MNCRAACVGQYDFVIKMKMSGNVAAVAAVNA
jgi:hypothetical protein